MLTGLTQGVTYYVRISAKNSLGYGPACALVYAKPMQLPSVPLGVQLLLRGMDCNNLRYIVAMLKVLLFLLHVQCTYRFRYRQ